MSRLTDAILQNTTAYAQGHSAPMVDLKYGGQMGYAPELAEWVSNAAYVRRNLICVLLEAPKGFQYLPNPDYWISTLRALVELHPLSIDGLNAGLEVEFAQNPVGGAGQQQEDVTDVKETQSSPTFRWGEKHGMPIASFFRGWITNLMMDPNSKYANIATLSNRPTDMLPDMYTASMLFIEPDPLHNKVIKSWLGANMMPKGTGEITGRRDMTQANETPTYDIGFTGIFQYGLGVDQFAQKILDSLSITGANPQNRAAFVNAITSDILATKKSYSNEVQSMAANAVRV